jgi:hypothetical protein
VTTNTYTFNAGTGINASFQFSVDSSRENTNTLIFLGKSGIDSTYTVSGGDSLNNLTFPAGTGHNSTLTFMGTTRSSAVRFEGHSFAQASTVTVKGERLTRAKVKNGVGRKEVFENGKLVSSNAPEIG